MTTNSKNRSVFSKSDTMKFLEKKAGSPLTIATLLVAIRKSEEISQVDFADLLEISRSHLCDIEKSRKGLSPARAAIFAKKLGYSEALFVKLALQDLLSREGIILRIDVA